ncbi:hypothetical protein C2S53_013334 [Perilla frutescens var. hirtella]|uniref:Uncharacterized protein n=1 Tax=Perilla frutescens var. hirtella TaxID=608512 RepID=A0AAD4PGD5_PERFH|nr:hypothetical protein C2S53_013334 [Perilla frutescens var. hirtella]
MPSSYNNGRVSHESDNRSIREKVDEKSEPFCKNLTKKWPTSGGGAVVGLTGKRLLLVGSTSYYSDLPEKLGCSAADPPSININAGVSAKKSASHINIPPRRAREHADLEQWLTHGSTVAAAAEEEDLVEKTPGGESKRDKERGAKPWKRIN